MSENQYVVIMAGGVGSRFWPFSRESHPKQFHDFLGQGKTLIQQTVERFEGFCPKENIFIVTNEKYHDLIKMQVPFLEEHQILLEPFMRNTAPCIAYASYKIYQKNSQANIVVAPADHIITKQDEFIKSTQIALEAASKNEIIVTLGIHPTRPDTGYGYIQVNEKVMLGNIHKVKTFTEKPNLELAKAFLASGDFVWNAGIFIFNVQTILKEFQEHLPDIHEAFYEICPHFYTEKEKKAIERAYSLCRSISIDYGVMEKSKNVYVLRADFGWSDLGTWKSLYEISDKDAHQNVIQGNVLTYETYNSIFKMPDEKLVVVQGLKNFIVAEYNNVLLICEKDQEQRIKDFVKDIREQKGDKYL
ncbi:MAG: mannose-1-phosphate guanylyltransferase [Cytophagales bacterium]|nr:mannose-1-phosphate guanylyltransferase [Cytophagales bacterium]MDW8383968.1 mannose-1-phosphate guanylyltransferase [Flammeovirgaceae bacterium]